MDYIATTREAARALQCDQRTVERRARAGGYRYMCKHGGRYLINLSKEFPNLFKKSAGAGASTPASRNGGSY